MHHSSGRLVSGWVDASSKSAMNEPVSERAVEVVVEEAGLSGNGV